MNGKLLATVLLSVSALSANAADVAAGKAKSTMCAPCHGANGVSKIPMYPNLAGQKEQYLAKEIKSFKNGSRKDPVMEPMASSLSDADIANLAAYYAAMKR